MIARINVPSDAAARGNVLFNDTMRQVPAPPTVPSKPYFSLPYMNPLDFWFPVPLIRLVENNETVKLSFDGAGVYSMMSDPAGRFSFSALVYGDFAYRMAAVDYFKWQTTVPGFPLDVDFSDTVVSDYGDNPYRDTRAALSGSFSRSAGFLLLPGRFNYKISLGGVYARIADNDGGESAYQWEETGSAFGIYSGLFLSSLRRKQHEIFGTGLSLNVKGITVLDSFKPRIEGLFRAGVETRFPFSLSLYGAYDKNGMNMHGVSRSYGQPVFEDYASVEYSNPYDLRLTWLFGGEISAGLFSVEIQKNFSHAYFNRVYGLLTVRNALYKNGVSQDREGTAIGNLRLTQSLVLKFGLVSSFIPIKTSPFFIEPVIWGAWKFSNTITGEGYLLNYGVGLKVNN